MHKIDIPAWARQRARNPLQQLAPERTALLVIDKHRFSAFMPNSSDLHEALQARAVDTLIVTGTVTIVCCETTARDAHMLGYKIVFVSDANAALSDEEHNASLLNMTTIFGEVRDTAGTIELITQQHAASFAGAGQRGENRQAEVSATARIGSP